VWRTLYNLLLVVLLPVLPIRLWWRARKEPGYRKHIGERFGFYSNRPTGPIIWLHAVSLGETRAAQPLVNALRERYPDHQLLITHMTATGRAAGEELFPGALIAYLPYDYPYAVRRFLQHFKPRVGILMETEIWPNLVRECRRRVTPLVLANARLSARSAKSYSRVATFAREVFKGITAVGAQSEADAARLADLGAINIAVTGNLKFDVTTPLTAAAGAANLRQLFGERLVLLAASTREGEEALLVLVPRHPQRFDDVAALLRQRGVPFVRRSENNENKPIPTGCTVVLGDTMGELAAYYRASDVAFVGGSLLPFGAQNLIEACAAGVPVLIGPSSFNFAQAAQLAIEARAAHRVESADDLLAVAQRLLADRSQRRLMGRRGEEFAAAHRGATARTVAILTPLLGRG
jgi:3-deoxy-D-manno-octulosonic-acid transferase